MNEILVQHSPGSGRDGLRRRPASPWHLPARRTPRRPRHRRRRARCKDAAKLKSPALSMDKRRRRPSKAARWPFCWATASTPRRCRPCSRPRRSRAGGRDHRPARRHRRRRCRQADEGQSRGAQRASVVYDAVSFRPASAQPLRRSRWRSVSSMKPFATASRSPSRPTARPF